MWEIRGTNRAFETEASDDLSRRSLQWKTHKNRTFPWKKISSYSQTRDIKNTGNFMDSIFQSKHRMKNEK